MGRVYRVRQAGGAECGKVSEIPRAAKPSIIVLPFTNMSGDPQQEFFVDGLTEDILTDLRPHPDSIERIAGPKGPEGKNDADVRDRKRHAQVPGSQPEPARRLAIAGAPFHLKPKTIHAGEVLKVYGGPIEGCGPGSRVIIYSKAFDASHEYAGMFDSGTTSRGLLRWMRCQSSE